MLREICPLYSTRAGSCPASPRLLTKIQKDVKMDSQLMGSPADSFKDVSTQPPTLYPQREQQPHKIQGHGKGSDLRTRQIWRLDLGSATY
jgi:hypothetical protein